jgi:phosphoglycolate phosphatase
MALVIFDLDGTLIDSKKDLVNSVNATRAEVGMPPLSDQIVSSYIGNGAPVLIQRALRADATESELKNALEFFLAHYRAHCVDNTVLYPGVADGLAQLHEASVALAVLTNKPVRISRLIMEHLGVGKLLFQIYGGNSFEFKKPHPIGIERLRAESPADTAVTWMVGDTPVDVQTARNAGVSACGVAWGFQPESFAVTPPDLVINEMQELVDLIGRGSR